MTTTYRELGCRWSTVALLLVIIAWLVVGLGGAERENARLRLRIKQLEPIRTGRAEAR